MANSPLFFRSKKVENTIQALTLLGLDSALSLTLSFSLYGALKQDNSIGVGQNFWRRSIICAVISRELGAAIAVPNIGALFLAGLLQDLGILALSTIEGDRYVELFHSSDTHCILAEKEKAIVGVEHAVIGAYLADTWHLPSLLVNAIASSHTLDERAELGEKQLFSACVALSGPIADLWIDDSQSECSDISAAIKALGLNDEMVEELIDRVEQELPELSRLFEFELLDRCDIEAIQQKSKDVQMIRELRNNIRMRQQNTQVEHIERRSRNLDAYFDQNLADVIRNLSLSDEILAGLLHRSGPCGFILRTVLAHERGEWDQIDWAQLEQRGISADSMRDAYQESIAWSESPNFSS